MKRTASQPARFVVRPACDSDLPPIHEWLLEEKSLGSRDSFLCNWEQTVRWHERGLVNVCVDKHSAQVVGYQSNDLTSPGILEVRRDFRRLGVGKALVKHRVLEVRKQNECMLYIQCTPESSLPFWRAMGFIPIAVKGWGDSIYAYKILSQRHRLSKKGTPVKVEISIFLESKRSGLKPYSKVRPQAVRTPAGLIQLAERVVCFERLYENLGLGDPYFKILVNGRILFNDKAKRDQAELLGIQRCKNGFYLDRISPVAKGSP